MSIQENKTPHNFCETPKEKCTMNYCDENGCQNRKRHLVSENKKLREALEGLYNYTKNHRDLKGYIKFEYLLGKAKEALKEVRMDICEKCGYPTFKMHHENIIRCHGCNNAIELKGG